MKTLREINWRAAWFATKWLCGCVGAIVMLAWFAVWPGFLMAVSAGILLAAVWYSFYGFRVNTLARSSGRPTPKGQGPAAGAGGRTSIPAAPVPPIRMRYVGFDPETGDEIRVAEPA